MDIVYSCYEFLDIYNLNSHVLDIPFIANFQDYQINNMPKFSKSRHLLESRSDKYRRDVNISTLPTCAKRHYATIYIKPALAIPIIL